MKYCNLMPIRQQLMREVGADEPIPPRSNIFTS